MAVNDVLEVLGEAHVERLEVVLALDDFEKTIQFVDG